MVSEIRSNWTSQVFTYTLWWLCEHGRSYEEKKERKAGGLITHELLRNDRCVSAPAAWRSGCDPMCIDIIHMPDILTPNALHQAAKLFSDPYSVGSSLTSRITGARCSCARPGTFGC